MKPVWLKTVGYLISTASVLLLGVAAWPGAQKAGLLPALWLGMATSIFGMACRWWSYELQHRLEGHDRPPEAKGPSPGSLGI